MTPTQRTATIAVLLALAGCGAPAHARTSRLATPTPSPSASATVNVELPPSILARIPKFPPAPPPVPVMPPAGDSAGWYSAIATTQPVAFITIDDGWTKVPQGPALLRAAHVPVTLFLEVNAIESDPGYFRQMQQAGAVIEAHTITHRNLKGASYAVQKHEICGSADQLGQLYGRRPLLFRPPFGDKDATTLRVVHECGLHAAFFWRETTDKGIVRYQTAEHRVHPGDIILMHFRPAFIDDFLAVLAAISQAGLTPARLEDYVG